MIKIPIVDSSEYFVPDDRAGQLIISTLFCDRPVSQQWVGAMDNLQYPERMSIGHLNIQNFGQDKLREITNARTRIVERAAQMGAKYLFFADDDTIPPPDALTKLLFALRENPNAKICGGIYPKRRYCVNEGEWTIWNGGCQKEFMIRSFERDTIFPVGGLGFGCVLIDLSVVPQLPRPWFNYYVPTSFQDPISYGEDMWFCDLVRNAGFQVLAHGGVLPIHECARRVLGPFTLGDDGKMRDLSGKVFLQSEI